MRRTTVNVVSGLQSLGAKAFYENTGGGVMAGIIELPSGRRVYFTDDVPDEVYELETTTVAPAVVRTAWKDYGGGFDLVDTDGEHVFSGSIGGSHNLHAGFATAMDTAEEYVKICKALDPNFDPTPPQLPPLVNAALERFLTAGYDLLNSWRAHDRNDELSWLAGPDRYPHYLPSFDDFLLEFGAKLRGER